MPLEKILAWNLSRHDRGHILGTSIQGSLDQIRVCRTETDER